MNRINILKIFLPVLLFVIFFNFSFSQNLSKNNLSVNIEWQAIDSYTPTFYEGRAIPGEESYVKAVAILDTNSISESVNINNLFYSWKYNDYYLYNYSGTGSKIVYFILDRLQSFNTLELSVYFDSTQEKLLGSSSIKIRPFSSLPILYKKNGNPIITYSNAINKKYEDLEVKSGDSFNIIAEPYFFSAKNSLDPALNYSWVSDDIFNGNIGSNIYEYFAGSVNKLELKISNSQKILQEGEVEINFSVNR